MEKAQKSFELDLLLLGLQFLNGIVISCIRDTHILSNLIISPLNSVGIPRIDKLEIEGRGFHTNLYAVRGVYSGGKEGKSKIQWLRSMVGSPDLISIPGMYLYFRIIIILHRNIRSAIF